MSDPPLASAPELITDRLVLRAWRESDRAPFAAMNADPVVMEMMPAILDRAASDDLLDRIVGRWQQHRPSLWAVEVPGVTAMAGWAGLLEPGFDAHFTPCVEVGWRLRADCWGQGFATEAARAALRHGFDELDLTEIVSFTSELNLRSRRVMEKLGMRRDPADDFDHPSLPDRHRLRRHVLHRIDRDGWQTASTAPVTAG